MIISNLAVLLAERKLKVADLVRSTGINKSICTNFIMMNLYGLILKPLIKFVLH